MGSSKVRVLHCPTDTGNQAWVLSRAERALGLESDVMVFRDSWLGYQLSYNLGMNLRRPMWSIAKLLWFFQEAIRKYDVFHFNFGSSFIPQAIDLKWFELCDLALLKRLGKGIVVTYNGSDARQGDYCAEHYSISPYEPHCEQPRDKKKDALKRRRIEKFGRYADVVFALNTDLLRVLPAKTEFLPYASVDLREWRPTLTKRDNRCKVRIVHASTHRRGEKGTGYIIEAVDRLRGEGHQVELEIVQNVPHSKVRSVYENADIAVDQLLTGWYGGFAVEMMALGKPVVSYIRNEDLGVVPKRMRMDMPIIRAEPDTIYNVLASTIRNESARQMQGRRGREYVERWHDPIKIAARMKEVYESIS